MIRYELLIKCKIRKNITSKIEIILNNSFIKEILVESE